MRLALRAILAGLEHRLDSAAPARNPKGNQRNKHMRMFKLIGALLVPAIAALAVATASAEVEFLPGTAGTKFTGSAKKVFFTLKNSKAEPVSLLCKKEKSTGEQLSSTDALILAAFEACEFGGLGIHSVGDPAQTILVHFEAKACTITSSPLVGGVLLKPLPVVLEVPASKLNVELDGAMIGRLLPENVANTKVFNLDLNPKEGKQEFTKCKDGTGTELTEELKANVDAGGFLPATVSAEDGLLQFTVNKEWMT
jgi:hypothetical protein